MITLSFLLTATSNPGTLKHEGKAVYNTKSQKGKHSNEEEYLPVALPLGPLKKVISGIVKEHLAAMNPYQLNKIKKNYRKILTAGINSFMNDAAVISKEWSHVNINFWHRVG